MSGRPHFMQVNLKNIRSFHIFMSRRVAEISLANGCGSSKNLKTVFWNTFDVFAGRSKQCVVKFAILSCKETVASQFFTVTFWGNELLI